MSGESLKVVDGAVAGAWIGPRLAEDLGPLVKQQIPTGYDARVRILHPASDREGNPVAWAEVARKLGRTVHSEVQWHAIVGSPDPPQMSGSEWPGGNPPIGELDLEPLKALCEILSQHTSEADDCFFGLSTIHGGVEEALGTKPLLRFPHRDFVILSGALSAVDEVGFVDMASTFFSFAQIGEEPPPQPRPSERFCQQPPNLIWPADRAWYVASEYDLDSTLVGGSEELIAAIDAAPELETWSVGPEDSLGIDADTINPIPPELG